MRGVVGLVVVSPPALRHHIIIPFFSNLEFKTRKLVDFKLWIIAIKLHIYGYYLLAEGKFLLLKNLFFIIFIVAMLADLLTPLPLSNEFFYFKFYNCISLIYI